jgi:hypothetical protein
MGTRDRIVMVRAGALEDLIDLARTAADLIDVRAEIDPLSTALRGSIAAVTAEAVIEPVGS